MLIPAAFTAASRTLRSGEACSAAATDGAAAVATAGFAIAGLVDAAGLLVRWRALANEANSSTLRITQMERMVDLHEQVLCGVCTEYWRSFNYSMNLQVSCAPVKEELGKCGAESSYMLLTCGPRAS